MRKRPPDNISQKPILENLDLQFASAFSSLHRLYIISYQFCIPRGRITYILSLALKDFVTNVNILLYHDNARDFSSCMIP